MLILGSSKIGTQRRVNIQGLGFDKGEKLIIAIDVEYECLRLLRESELAGPAKGCGNTVNVDDKYRIIIPQWIIEEFGELEELHLALGDNAERLLIKKTAIFG